jgi:hypothetical protein|tara:strand:- start:1843 stop:2073 length:231 start_codon:yes stop_codon:yes gene_type:complete
LITDLNVILAAKQTPLTVLNTTPDGSHINFFSELFILIASIIFIIVVRLALEGYIVIFSAAQKIQQFVDYKMVELE